jgi:HK97 family phage major capsid protein
MDVELKTALSGIRDGVLAFEPKLTALQKQVDAIDKRGLAHHTGGDNRKSLGDLLAENDQFQRLLADKRGKAIVTLRGTDALLLDRKTTITELAAGTQITGVLPIGRLPGITTEARQQLTIRDALTATPTTFQVVDYVKVLSPMGLASPTAEASTKPENAVTFTSLSERVKVIATWIPASRQVLDDMPGLVAFINHGLAYYLDAAEELQMLSGDNVGEDLHGIIPQASAFNSGLLSPAHGWNTIDIVGSAIQQITAAAELQPTFVVLHPNDWWKMRLTKDAFGRYILGDPQQAGFSTPTGYAINPTQNLFGLQAIPTTNIAQGTFLVGSGSPVACEIMDRLETQIDVSTEHSTFFTQNLVAIRAEKRLALVTRRPGSFVTGSFTTSP